MTLGTNPYQTWLGLNVTSRPDCYTLLGLPMYEADTGKILVAAQNAMSRASIPMAPADEPLRQTLLSEIQLAQTCLLDPAQKLAYDQQLQAYFQAQSAPVAPTAPMAASPMSAAPIGAPMGSAPSAQPATKPSDSGDINLKARKASTAKNAKSRARNSSMGLYAGGGALLLLAAIAGGAYYAFKTPAEPEPVAHHDPQPQAKPKVEEPEDTPRGQNKPPQPPKGTRPTSGELANSIPGLGNPMDNMPAMPAKPTKPVEPMATAKDQDDLKAAIANAWAGIAKRDYAMASTALDAVRKIPKTDEGKAEFSRVDQFVQDLMAYNRALNEGLGNLRENEELTVGSTQFTITTIDDNRIVLRYAGQNRGYQRDELPDGLQRAIAISRLKGEETDKQRIEASMLLLSPKADIEYVRDLWMRSGADAGALAQLEAEKQKYVAGQMVASNNPNNTNMTSPPGNPSTTMPNAGMPNTGMTGTTLPMNLPPGATSAEKLAALLKQARQQLIARNAGGAIQTLADAEPLATLPQHQAKVKRLEELSALNEQFWQAVSKQLTKLPPDEDLDVHGKLTRVVESDANRLVLRINGENHRYTLSDIPAGLAKFLAERELPNQVDTKKILGAFLLVTPEGGAERAREEWSAAFLPAEEIDELVAVLKDPYKLADDFIEQAPVPAETEVMAPAAAFLESWKSRMQSAQKFDDHAKLGQQMAEAARELPNGSPEQFAAFRYSLAEAARGNDFETCTAIIDDWHTRFTIDQGEWHLKAMQLASSSTTTPGVHARIVEHALEQIPKLKATGDDKVVPQMLKIAEDSAAKSRNRDLVEAVKQLESNP